MLIDCFHNGLVDDVPTDMAPNHTSIDITGEGDPWVVRLTFVDPRN